MNPLLHQSQQLETALHTALRGTTDNAELELIGHALIDLQRCMENLERLPEQKYRMLEAGEIIQEGDEWLNPYDLKWRDSVAFGGHVVPNGKPYRRPIRPAQPQDFAAIEQFLVNCNSAYAQGMKQEDKA